MKKVELDLIAELLKNSRRSDRELAKTIGVSQPTVSRTLKRLERSGVVQEYTMIPNLARLGYEILALTLVKLNHQLSSKEIDEAQKLIKNILRVTPLEVLMLERGMGMGFDGAIISCHKNYASLVTFTRLLKETGFLDVNRLESFRINLKDELHFIPLTFSLLAQAITLTREEEK